MPNELTDQLTEGFRPNHGRLEVAPRKFTNDPLSASAADMASYMRALLDPEIMARDAVLSAEAARDMRKPLGPNVEGFEANHHGFAGFAFSDDITGFGHGGDSAYQVSNMVLVPALGIGIFASTNTPTAGDLVRRGADRLRVRRRKVSVSSLRS